MHKLTPSLITQVHFGNNNNNNNTITRRTTVYSVYIYTYIIMIWRRVRVAGVSDGQYKPLHYA